MTTYEFLFFNINAFLLLPELTDLQRQDYVAVIHAYRQIVPVHCIGLCCQAELRGYLTSVDFTPRGFDRLLWQLVSLRRELQLDFILLALDPQASPRLLWYQYCPLPHSYYGEVYVSCTEFWLKPDTGMILTGVEQFGEKLGTTRSRCLLVGISELDRRLAANAGIAYRSLTDPIHSQPVLPDPHEPTPLPGA
jgi:hypothetical protein